MAGVDGLVEMAAILCNKIAFLLVAAACLGCTEVLSSRMSTVGNELGVTEKVTDLIRKDFIERSRTGNLHITPTKEQIEELKAGHCPLDGRELLVVPLPASKRYTDLSNEAYVCPADRVYWVRHTQGAFSGTVSVWRGPFGPLR
jgi:hypothetical protein